MMTNQEDQKSSSSPNGSQDVEEGWAASIPSCCQETRNLFAGKGRCFLRPQTRRGCRFLICGAARVLAASSSNTSAVVSDEEYGAVEERVLRSGRNGPRRTSSLPHWRPRWIETKLTDRSATYVLTEAAVA
ncbi:hypothetical protein GWK47_026930 [Chionoecetes opilio]|uniref:Uncharacterized protein n=1 Tax=Chionoecetes opilio TaxID=41210 RepID=A0A8J8WC32_CHIOP|nr:hypothetical protein GWK47_026930 [Chionoecetes opilio]